MRAFAILLLLAGPAAAEANSWQLQNQLQALGLERLGQSALEEAALHRKLQRAAEQQFLHRWRQTLDRDTQCQIIERESAGRARCE